MDLISAVEADVFDNICFELRKHSREISRFYNNLLTKLNFEINISQLDLLLAINELIKNNNSPTASRIGNFMYSDRATISRNCLILVNKGYLKKEKNYNYSICDINPVRLKVDGRCAVYSFTDEGYNLCERGIECMVKINDIFSTDKDLLESYKETSDISITALRKLVVISDIYSKCFKEDITFVKKLLPSFFNNCKS